MDFSFSDFHMHSFLSDGIMLPVELIRFAAYGQFNAISCAVVAGCMALAFGLAVRGYDPLVGAIRLVKRD